MLSKTDSTFNVPVVSDNINFESALPPLKFCPRINYLLHLNII